MGYWFGNGSKKSSWRKTPTKINDDWYTSSGEKIENPKRYFKAVRENGTYWKGDTGWEKNNWKYHKK